MPTMAECAVKEIAGLKAKLDSTRVSKCSDNKSHAWEQSPKKWRSEGGHIAPPACRKCGNKYRRPSKMSPTVRKEIEQRIARLAAYENDGAGDEQK